MSAGAQQSAIDALREDEDVIVIEKSRWFKNLHTTIHHAATHKTFEDYLYDPLMEILGTYVKTYNHEDLQASVIPQGCFELRTDASTTVSRRLSDLLVIIHTVNLSNPRYSKSRLGGWLEAKPWTQAPKSKKKEAANTGTKPDTGQADSAGQDERRGKGITTEANEVKNVTDEVSEQLKDNTVETDTKLEDINEVVEVDITEEEVRAGEGPTMLVGGPSIEDASALVLDSQEVIRRLVEDLPQLCQQAYFAFHHFSEDVIHVLLTYGMTFSCFKFIRPANWDSIQDNKEGTVDAPTVIFSNEHMVFLEQINPHLLQAFRLMTASLGLSYQPSWFDPPAHDIVKPDLSVANAALTQYHTKLRRDLASPETTTVSSKSGSSNYSLTASEAATPVGESEHNLQSGKGHLTTSAPNLEPVAENKGIETCEPALEQQNRTGAASSDADDSPLNQHLQSKLVLPGRARQAIDAPVTSGVPGAAGLSMKDTNSLAGNTRAPAFKDLTSGVNSKDKFIMPKNCGKQIPKPHGKARQWEDNKSHTEATGPPLSALLSLPINDAPTGGSGSHAFGHLPISQEANGDDSQTGMHSKAKSRKQKGRPSSPLRFDSPNPDPAGNSMPTLAGPSKK